MPVRAVSTAHFNPGAIVTVIADDVFAVVEIDSSSPVTASSGTGLYPATTLYPSTTRYPRS